MWPPMGYKHLTVLMEVLKQNQTLKDKKACNRRQFGGFYRYLTTVLVKSLENLCTFANIWSFVSTLL